MLVYLQATFEFTDHFRKHKIQNLSLHDFVTKYINMQVLLVHAILKQKLKNT